MSDKPAKPRIEAILKHYKGATFQNGTIELDGCVFEDYAFVNCEIVYKGGPFEFLGTIRRENVKWTFDGAAQRTIRLIRLLQSDRALIQQIFPGIVPPD
jgi:hypothetical protein